MLMKSIKYLLLIMLMVLIGLGLMDFLNQRTVESMQLADKVEVYKLAGELHLERAGEHFKTYHVVFGENPYDGHKQQEGDERTPEGLYTLDYKNEQSIAYRSIHISYPNAADTQRADAAGVSAGGFIMIHGQRNGLGWLGFLAQRFNWTNGCIAVTNAEMDEIMQAIEIGTPIEIFP